jgi:hypothetical protein
MSAPPAFVEAPGAIEKLEGLILLVNEAYAGGGALFDPPPQPVNGRIPDRRKRITTDGGISMLFLP